MATKVIAGKTVQVNDEGFMTNPAEWTKEMAPEIAKEEGIAELTRRSLEGDRLLPRGLEGARRQVAHAAADHHRHRPHDQGSVCIVPEGPGQEGRARRGAGETGRVCLSWFGD